MIKIYDIWGSAFGSLSFHSQRACSSVAASAIAPSSSLAVRRRIVPPYYARKTYPARKGKHLLQEKFPNAGDADGSGPRLYDYLKMGEIVRNLPTVGEKIEFVNPYERPWNDFEKRWRRRWHPELMFPRKAWSVPKVPLYFDSLNFYKYITKMRTTIGLDALYEGLVPPTANFEAKLTESLISSLTTTSAVEDSEKVTIFLRYIVEDAIQSLVKNDQVQDCRISFNPRCESFWIRSGFLSLYERKELDEDIATIQRSKCPKFVCDDRRRLGELSFVFRDQLASHIRRKEPLKQLFPISNISLVNAPVFNDSINVKKDVIFSPKVFNMWPDEEPLWQCPGFEPDSGEPYKYGHVAFKNTSAIHRLCSNWNCDTDEKETIYREGLIATAVASLFSWLNGQAHSLGFTQYNDIESSLVSQLVMFDGQNFSFAVAQLNTIAINIDVEGFINDRTNVCYFEGPFSLYDRFDDQSLKFYHNTVEGEKEGFRQNVLSRILQMIIKE